MDVLRTYSIFLSGKKVSILGAHFSRKCLKSTVSRCYVILFFKANNEVQLLRGEAGGGGTILREKYVLETYTYINILVSFERCDILGHLPVSLLGTSISLGVD